MQQKKDSIINFTMQSGLVLGIFWLFKYSLLIISKQFVPMGYIASFLSFVTPLFLLYYLLKYKNEVTGTNIRFWKGVKLGILLFFFASLIESVIVFMHIVWIDQTFISTINEQKLEMAQSLGFSDNIMQELRKQNSLSPFVFILNQILNNVFIGFLLSMIITPIVNRIKIMTKRTD